jgi:hypothetical protein
MDMRARCFRRSYEAQDTEILALRKEKAALRAPLSKLITMFDPFRVAGVLGLFSPWALPTAINFHAFSVNIIADDDCPFKNRPPIEIGSAKVLVLALVLVLGKVSVPVCSRALLPGRV